MNRTKKFPQSNFFQQQLQKSPFDLLICPLVVFSYSLIQFLYKVWKQTVNFGFIFVAYILS